MNVIIGLVVFVCILYIGWFFYQKTRKKAIFYNNFLQFCELLETEIGFFQNKLQQILEKNSYGKDFSSALKNFAEKHNLEEWGASQNLLKENELQELKNFFNKLGRVDSSTQTNEIRNFKKILEEKIEDIKTIQMKKSKMTFSLSVMLGLLAFIIII